MMKYMLTLLTLAVFIGVDAKKNDVQEYNNSSASDSIECLKQYSIYTLNLKKKMYNYTLEPWRYMFNNCPDAKIRVYSDGIKLYSYYYNKAKTETRKDEIVDTMMMIYDQRIKYFGTHPKYPEGWILGRKALDLMKYKRGNQKDMMDAYSWFSKSFELRGDQSEDVVLFTWLKTGLSLMNHGDISKDQFFNDFMTISAVFDVQIANASGSETERIKKIRNGCEDLFVKSGGGECASIENMLQEQFSADKDNAENVSRIVGLLDKLSCTDSPFYVEVVEKNYALNPDYKAAYQLAKLFVKKQDFQKSKTYYQEAINSCDDKAVKSMYCYELASIEFVHFQDLQEARELAREAVALKGDWGKPYILIGKIYAAGSKKFGKDEFEHSTVYWLATDSFSKAKSIDPSCAEEANEQIAIYTQYFPNKETLFFRGLKEGDEYPLGSWINETTIVRSR